MAITIDDALKHMAAIRDTKPEGNYPTGISICKLFDMPSCYVLLNSTAKGNKGFSSIEELCAFYETDVMPHFEIKENQ